MDDATKQPPARADECPACELSPTQIAEAAREGCAVLLDRLRAAARWRRSARHAIAAETLRLAANALRACDVDLWPVAGATPDVTRPTPLSLTARVRELTRERDALRAVADAAPGVLRLAWRGAGSMVDDAATDRMEDALRALEVPRG